ncbi:small nuclear ribonucleoprotein-associated protein b' [Anaeramoeba ignava]|uniref:Sm protein B n=1 Tax=Anaeramoeba ignava TaxID=1746090 RepID=A0A9Q0LQ55_ANAIG|nr:small nuclear ribonucleoprotein-associated protein b' [Anaeramoeba ignava]
MAEVLGRNKLSRHLKSKIRVTVGKRTLVGQFLAFDRHMNIVLGDCEEFRRIKPKKGQKEIKEEKRTLGLLILRGETIVSISIESPPPQETQTTKLQSQKKPEGIAKAVGRGMPTPLVTQPSMLQGPIRGIGGPTLGVMTPQHQTIQHTIPPTIQQPFPRGRMPQMGFQQPIMPMRGAFPPRPQIPQMGIPNPMGMQQSRQSPQIPRTQ